MYLEDISIPIRKNYKRQKRAVLIASFVFALLIGPSFLFIVERSFADRILDFVFLFIHSALIFSWCHYDSLERNKRMSIRFRVSIVLFSVFALFYYFLYSRGLKKGIRTIGISILIYAGGFIVGGLSGVVIAEIFDITIPD